MFNHTLSSAATANAQAEFQFEGTAVWIACRVSIAGGNISVAIDNQISATFDLWVNDPTAEVDQTFQVADSLSADELHTLTLTVLADNPNAAPLASGRYWGNLDAIIVGTVDESSSPSAATHAATQASSPTLALVSPSMQPTSTPQSSPTGAVAQSSTSSASSPSLVESTSQSKNDASAESSTSSTLSPIPSPSTSQSSQQGGQTQTSRTLSGPVLGGIAIGVILAIACLVFVCVILRKRDRWRRLHTPFDAAGRVAVRYSEKHSPSPVTSVIPSASNDDLVRAIQTLQHEVSRLNQIVPDPTPESCRTSLGMSGSPVGEMMETQSPMRQREQLSSPSVYVSEDSLIDTSPPPAYGMD